MASQIRNESRVVSRESLVSRSLQLVACSLRLAAQSCLRLDLCAGKG
jgi:hypothetical protein